MNTFKLAFERMQQNPSGIAKAIGYYLLITVAYLVFASVASCLFPLLILTIPISIFMSIFQYSMVWDVFVESQETTISSVFETAWVRFKENGWRVFGFILLLTGITMGIVLFILICFGVTLGSSVGGITEAEVVFGFLALMVIFIGVALVGGIIGMYSQYVIATMALGQPRAMRQSLGQWKNILICEGILLALACIPIIGWILLIGFQFILPLKIALDVRSSDTTLVSEGSNETQF